MKSTSRLRIWWLSPAWLFPLFLIPFCFLAYLTPASTYDVAWKSFKFFDLSDIGYATGLVVAFLAGGGLASSLSRKAPPGEWGKFSEQELDLIFRIFRIGSILVVAAYLIWMGIAARNGVSLSSVAQLAAGDGSASYGIRDEATTLPGVTTATQFGMAVFILGTILMFNGRMRSVRYWMGGILLLTMFRSFAYSERLATIEVMIPALTLACFYCREKLRHYLTGIQAIIWPILAMVALYVLFTGSEYFRSWTGAYAETGEYSSVWSFSLERLTGYYVTALNNGSVIYSTIGTNQIPATTFDWFWKFPFVGRFVYALLPTTPVELYGGEVLGMEANPEFNNTSGIFPYAMDWGEDGTYVMFIIVGFLIFSAYLRFVNGYLGGLLLYPFMITGMTEIARIPYWTSARAFPSWALLFLTFYLITQLRRSRRFMEGQRAAQEIRDASLASIRAEEEIPAS